MNETDPKTPLVSDRVFKLLRMLVEYILPATSALYFGLDKLYGWDNSTQVVGTISLITIFLASGVLLARKAWLDSDTRFDGAILLENVNEEDGTAEVRVGLDPHVLNAQNEVLLRVGKHRES